MKKITMMISGMMLLVACQQQPNQEQVVQLSEEQVLAKGKYLVKMGACHDCHTPKVFDEDGMHLDESRLLSGHPEGAALPVLDPKALEPGYWVLFNEHFTAAVGPWGRTYARNLTPHETGLKGWTAEVFIDALRTGQHMGSDNGRPIMPPMPWENLSDVSDEDLTAIFKYLQSLPPVKNYVPEPLSADEIRQGATL